MLATLEHQSPYRFDKSAIWMPWSARLQQWLCEPDEYTGKEHVEQDVHGNQGNRHSERETYPAPTIISREIIYWP